MLYAVQSWRNLAGVDKRRCDELAAWFLQIPICGRLMSHGVDNGRAIGHMLSIAEQGGWRLDSDWKNLRCSNGY